MQSNSPKILAVVTARGGSKGVPRKNVRDFCGRPLIAWTLLAADVEGIDLVVSTEDQEIADVSRQYGVQVVPRPEHLATDEAKSVDVLQYTLTEVEKERGYTYDYVLTLQPTSPLRTREDMEYVVGLVAAEQPDSLVSVVQLGYAPGKLKVIRDGYVEDLVEAEVWGRRQDQESVYVRNSAFYVTRREDIFKGLIVAGKIRAYEMPEERSVDIDTEMDFALAEQFARKMRLGESSE